MPKPKTFAGYSSPETDACERVLVTLLRGLGPWKNSVFLIGGLTPRYLVPARPPAVPAHAGTGDVDVVVDVALLTSTDAYRTLEENLKTMGFDRAENEQGRKQSWRWQKRLADGPTMILEFLTDAPDILGGKIMELPTEGNVSALNIPHSSMVFDLHDKIDITVELLDGGGKVTETVRYANIVSFTCLKAFAFDHRGERKDAHDLVYCIQHAEGGVEELHKKFRAALDTKHRDIILKALTNIAARFCDDKNGEGYLKDGPVATARFEGFDDDGDLEQRDRRLLRQRQASDLISRVFLPLLKA